MNFFNTAFKKLGSLKKTVFNFFAENFSINSSKLKKITGAVIFLLTLSFVLVRSGNYIEQDFSGKWAMLIATVIFSVFLGLITAFSVAVKKEKTDKILHFVVLFLMPLVTMIMTECLNGVFVYDMTYMGFFFNYATILLMFFIVFALCGSFRVSYISVNTVLFLFATTHCYLMDFRGTPFLPMDFFSISTGKGVASTYNYAPNYKLVTATLIFIFIIIVAIKTKTPKYNFLTKVISRSAAATVSAVMIILFFNTNVFTDMGIHPDFWNQNRGYRNYGFVFSFVSNTKYLYMSEPDEYDPENIQSYVDNVVDKTEKQIPDDNYKKPNIICIMNESLADMKVLGDFETNEDYMPFLRSLKENTIKGNLYVPVIGAGTSNTEFEFLTGHSTAFLPSGSNAYMLYIKSHIASLVSTMEAQGYSSYALHPYYAIGWKRNEVYKNLGFDKFISLEDILDLDIMRDYQDHGNDLDYLQSLIDKNYPGTNMLIRQYVSDEYNYKLLIEDFEKRDKSVPYFAFNVTMQNHGGYTGSCVNFDENIYTTSTSNAYIKTNKYLSLVKKSDDAFKQLIEYFSKVKEPTVICMFGDHQPSIETSFISEILGTNNLSNLKIEQEQNRHCTPFYIWANYDIEEQYIDKLSSNYLSSLVLQTAGIKLTDYNKYLLTLAKTLPVIDTVGYIDKDNNYYKWSQDSPYLSILSEYEKIQYNNVFDRQHVNLDIFYINGYQPPEETVDSAEGDG